MSELYPGERRIRELRIKNLKKQDSIFSGIYNQDQQKTMENGVIPVLTDNSNAYKTALISTQNENIYNDININKDTVNKFLINNSLTSKEDANLLINSILDEATLAYISKHQPGILKRLSKYSNLTLNEFVDIILALSNDDAPKDKTGKAVKSLGKPSTRLYKTGGIPVKTESGAYEATADEDQPPDLEDMSIPPPPPPPTKAVEVEPEDDETIEPVIAFPWAYFKHFTNKKGMLDINLFSPDKVKKYLKSDTAKFRLYNGYTKVYMLPSVEEYSNSDEMMEYLETFKDMGGSEAKIDEAIDGTGFKRRQIKGRGVGPRNYEHSNEVMNKRPIIHGRGYSENEDKKYKSYRRYYDKIYIDLQKLNNNILFCKYINNNSNTAIPTQIISDDLKDIINDTLTDKYNKKVYDSLALEDKQLFKRFVKLFNFNIYFQPDTQEQEFKQKYKILVGSYYSGNDSPELKKELLKYVRLGIAQNLIHQKSAFSLLYELT